jgi:hypothetical protein
MSQENVEVVRRWFAAIAEGELASDLWDADVIVDNIPLGFVQGARHGSETTVLTRGQQRLIHAARVARSWPTRLGRRPLR